MERSKLQNPVVKPGIFSKYTKFRLHIGSGAIFLVGGGGGGGKGSSGETKIAEEIRILKTAVLCFTLHLLKKVGGYSSPPRLGRPCYKIKHIWPERYDILPANRSGFGAKM